MGKKNNLEDNILIALNAIKDRRGSFRRLYCKNQFFSFSNKTIKQINYSYTKMKGTVRGLHYQVGKFKEDKFVICLKGRVFDVAVDLRKNSKTFLKYKSSILSSSNIFISFIPRGFAHGFQTLTNNVEMLYFHTNFFKISHEKSLNVLEPKISINWPLKISSISKKDRLTPFINSRFKGI